MAALFVGSQPVFQALAALGVGALLLIAGCLLLDSLLGLLDGFRRLGLACKVGVLFIVAQLALFGGAKHGTNDVEGSGCTNGNGEAESFPLQGERLRGPFLSGRPSQSLTSGKDSASPLSASPCSVADVVRGYRLESVVTNDDISYAMPSGATVRGTWHLTGAYEDVQKVSLGDFRFPLGTNLCSSLWTYTWGKVRPQLKNTVNEIAAVGAPMSAIPDTSRFWTAATSNDTYMLTWENFAVGRQSLTTNNQQLTTLSAQIELHRNGDFITRSNNVESVYRRVIEPNPDPLHPYGPVQDLSVINETNAYCWVDIVVNNADTWVRFEGDGPSNLADPRFAAKAGETNHVVILIGKTYKVTCDVPFSVVGKSDPAIDERWEDARTVWLNWPVVITALEDGVGPRLLSAGLRLMGAGPTTNGFTMCVEPEGLGGAFTWTNSCCSVSGSGTHFSYSCGGQCFCTGCAAKGCYCYEGYRIGCKGGWCGCSSVPGEWEGNDDPYDSDPAPSVSVRFEDDAVIFEDAYTNAPGEVVERNSTRTVLHLVVHGGMKGGTATFSFENRDKLVGFDIPTSLDVPAGHCMSYQFTYRGNSPSGEEDDVIVRGEFTENNAESGSDPLEAEAKLTCVQVELTAVYKAPGNSSQSRHVYGVGEDVRFTVAPALADVKIKAKSHDQVEEMTTHYNSFGGDGEVDGSAARVYTCPVVSTYGPDVTVSCRDAEYRPLMETVEPQEVVTPRAEWNGGCFPTHTVGEAGLYTYNYIGPMHVSFQGIAVSEIPCDENDIVPPTGYFTNRVSSLFHGTNQCSNTAHWIKTENYWMQDNAYSTQTAGENWSAGTLIWKIPVGWHRKNMAGNGLQGVKEPDYELYGDKDGISRPLLIGGRRDLYLQTREILEDGTFRSTKYGHWITRGTLCRIILDGSTIQWFKFH